VQDNIILKLFLHRVYEGVEWINVAEGKDQLTEQSSF